MQLLRCINLGAPRRLLMSSWPELSKLRPTGDRVERCTRLGSKDARGAPAVQHTAALSQNQNMPPRRTIEDIAFGIVRAEVVEIASGILEDHRFPHRHVPTALSAPSPWPVVTRNEVPV
jgi:hypothetical protein